MRRFFFSTEHTPTSSDPAVSPSRPASTTNSKTAALSPSRTVALALLFSAALPAVAQDTRAPSVPTGLAATAASATRVNLTWNASTDDIGVKGYYVYLNNVSLGTTTATSFQHNGLAAGTVYNYRVSAYDAVPNHSAWTAVPVSVRTLATTSDTKAPSVPAGLKGAAASSTQINLSWKSSSDNVGVKGYHVYLNDVMVAATTTTSFKHGGRAPGTTYSYRVSAYDAVPNDSAWTATPVSVKTTGVAPPDTTPPSVPTGLTGTAFSASQVNLTWKASSDSVGVKGYYVYLNDKALGTTTATSFQHSGLTAGTTYNYRVSAYDAVPNHSAWTAAPISVKTKAVDGTVLWSCSFATAPTDCGFGVQEKVPGRATIVNIGRDGGTAVRLHTEPGDNNVVGSGDMQRNDLWLSQADSDGYEGREAWWGLSVRFPDDFVFPTWQRYALSGFHHTGATGQGNFTLGFMRGALDTDPGVLGFQGFGGKQDAGSFTGSMGPVVKNKWYDLVYHVKWSSGSDGIFQVWVNGVLKMNHKGPTMYAGQGVYFKLANYHTPLCNPYPACIGTDPASSVIYDRIIRGTTALSVSTGPLEGVLTTVNGTLTAVGN